MSSSIFIWQMSSNHLELHNISASCLYWHYISSTCHYPISDDVVGSESWQSASIAFTNTEVGVLWTLSSTAESNNQRSYIHILLFHVFPIILNYYFIWQRCSRYCSAMTMMNIDVHCNSLTYKIIWHSSAFRSRCFDTIIVISSL